MKCEKLFDVIDSLNEEYTSVWEDFCNIESPTSYKEGVDRASNYIVERAKKHDWKTESLKQAISGDVWCITMNPDAKGEPVSVSGHVDTVHPVGSFGNPAVTFDEEKIYGPGVADCKGGIVAAFMAMDALEKCGFANRPVQLLLQSDEEVSSITSNKETVDYMAEKSRNCIAFLNCESYHPHKLILTRKGIFRYDFEICGIAAHSSNCTAGANAVVEAAHKIIELEKMKDSKGLTCNCGIISGGTTANTVADKCMFVADIRFSNYEEMKEAEKKVFEVAEKSYIEGTTCKVVLKSKRVAMEKSEKNDILAEKISKIYDENGLTHVVPGHSAGGSDAADITVAGIPCVDSIGTEGGKIHTLDEYAYLKSLTESAKRIASVIYCI